MKPVITTMLVLGLTLQTGAIAQSPPQPAVYRSGADLASAMAGALRERPAMGAANVTTTDHYRINLITRTEPAGAIVHRPGTELHYITDGAGVLVTGGTVVRPADGGQGNIEGGVAQRVVKGDAILIPEGTPHQYTAVEGSVSYLEVRFNVPVE